MAKVTGPDAIPVPDAVWTVLLAYLAELKATRSLDRTENKQTGFRSKDVVMWSGRHHWRPD